MYYDEATLETAVEAVLKAQAVVSTPDPVTARLYALAVLNSVASSVVVGEQA